jgi:hypothetical protein
LHNREQRPALRWRENAVISRDPRGSCRHAACFVIRATTDGERNLTMTRLTPATLLATTTFLGLLAAPAAVPAASPDGVVPKVLVRAAPPSPLFERFEQREGLFSLQRPANWRAYEAGDGVSFAPEGGIKDVGHGRRALLYGLILGQYDAPGSLEDAALSLVSQVLVTHPYLRPRGGASRPQETEGGSGLSMALSGRSSVTGEEEWVTVYARRLPSGRIVYAFGIVPGPEYDEAAGTFAQMVGTLAGSDDLIRRAARSRSDLDAAPRE